MINKKLKLVLLQIEKSKLKVSQERDKLRELHSELEDYLESFDAGIEELQEGLRIIESGVDTLSQYV